MSTINDGGAAFARPSWGSAIGGQQPGMSLRDYFAAKAMQGIWANSDVVKQLPSGSEAVAVALMSYEMADAMIKARSKW